MRDGDALLGKGGPEDGGMERGKLRASLDFGCSWCTCN